MGSRGARRKKRNKDLSFYTSSSSPSPIPPCPQSPFPPFAAHLYTGPRHRLLDNRKGLTTLSGQIVNLNEATQMNNKSITPNPQQPVDRVPTGQLPSALAELSEAALSDTLRSDVLPLDVTDDPKYGWMSCSYDGDDE